MIDSIFILAQAGAAGAEAAANAAAPAPPPPPALIQNLLAWLYLIGDPAFTTKGVLGSLLTWTKIIGLFCLVSWVGARVLSAVKQRIQLPALSGIAAAGLLGGLASILLQQLQSAGRLSLPMIAGVSPAVILGIISLFAVLAWVETLLWVSMNKESEKGDRLLLIAMHISLAFGILNGMLIYAYAIVPPGVTVTIVDFVAQGARMGLTYMGYTALVLLIYRLVSELGMFNPVRTLAIAWLARKEANRRMWAPYVVLTVFLVVLAFTHWFLVPPRPAEMSRLFVGTLTLLCSLLITLMIIFLSPLSLPTDIQQQTIYTIVSKPVSRLELIWGRIVGYMTLVTLMIGLFGAISYIYLIRQVNSTIRLTNQEANALRTDNPLRATQLDEQSEQLAARMSARVPVKGSLVFRDSRGTPQIKGIDVGQELEYRTHVEGATPSKGIWRYGVISHPFDEVGNMAARDAGRAPGKQNYPILDRRIPVSNFLRAGSIEYIDNEIKLLEARRLEAKAALIPAFQACRSSVGRWRIRMPNFRPN